MFSVLLPPSDWLIDRRHCELKWHSQAREIHDKIRAAVGSLPSSEQFAELTRQEGEFPVSALCCTQPSRAAGSMSTHPFLAVRGQCPFLDLANSNPTSLAHLRDLLGEGVWGGGRGGGIIP